MAEMLSTCLGQLRRPTRSCRLRGRTFQKSTDWCWCGHEKKASLTRWGSQNEDKKLASVRTTRLTRPVPSLEIWVLFGGALEVNFGIVGCRVWDLDAIKVLWMLPGS